MHRHTATIQYNCTDHSNNITFTNNIDANSNSNYRYGDNNNNNYENWLSQLIIDTGPIQPSDTDMGSGDSESDVFVITSTDDSVIMTPTPEGMHVRIWLLHILYYSTHSVILVCDPENTTTEQFGSYSWPETAVDDTVQLPCVFRPGYNASRTCTQGGSWVAVDVTNCRIS